MLFWPLYAPWAWAFYSWALPSDRPAPPCNVIYLAQWRASREAKRALQ